MKKLLSVLTACALLLSLTACALPAASLSSSSSSSAHASPTPARTPAPHPTFKTPYPTVSSYASDTDIPNVDFSGEQAASSSCWVCEDEDNIYAVYWGFLFCLEKATGEAEVIDDCSRNLAFQNEMVYYITYSTSDTLGTNDVIRRFNPETRETEDIFSTSSLMSDIAAYKGKLYYLLDEDPDSPGTDLYSVNPDGTDNQLIRKGFHSYCIYQDTIYYMAATPDGYYQETTLYQCGLDGSNKVKLAEGVLPDFSICGGMLFCPDSTVMVELATGDVVKMPECEACAPLGQYLVYERGGYSPWTDLYAYDTGTRQTYRLMRLNIDWVELCATQNGLYAFLNIDGRVVVKKLTIQNGSAALKQVGSIYTDYWDEEGEDEYDEWEDDFDPTTVTPLPLSSDTVIIADSGGTVIGGYSDGKWLTHTQAGAYCLNPITFYGCTLLGCTEPVQSSIAEYEESDEYSGTWSVDGGYDDHGFYWIDNLDGWNGEGPLEDEYFYTDGADRVPATELLTDTSAILPAIQGLIDEHLGAGAATAEIQEAVRADIDGDGEMEIVVNASNSEEYIYDPEAENLYTIACIIESDGSVHVIQQNYLDHSYYPDFADGMFVYVQNVIDIDGDGRCEIVLEGEAWEADWINVYLYDGNTVESVIDYSWGC